MGRSCLSILILFSLSCGDDDAPSDSGPRLDVPGVDTSTGQDSGPGTDAALTDSGGTDAMTGADATIPGTRSVFMLAGHLGRRMMTCDAGDSWVFDVSSDEVAHCWDMSGGMGPECDHHEWSNNGIAYGNGQFIATAGWGADNGLYADDGTSTEFSAWTRVLEGGFNGVAYGNGVWVAGSGRAGVSRDDGATFESIEALHFQTTRGAFFAPAMGGRHVIVADGPTIHITEDGADSFFEPDSIEGCGNVGIGGGESMILYNPNESSGCRSADGGHTWTAFSFGGEVRSRPVWTGDEYWVWGNGMRFSSSDGATWSQDTSTAEARFEHVARNDEGTLIGVEGEWGGFYERAALWRSTDGLTWERSAASDEMNGHPIRGITAGWVPASACE